MESSQKGDTLKKEQAGDGKEAPIDCNCPEHYEEYCHNCGGYMPHSNRNNVVKLKLPPSPCGEDLLSPEVKFPIMGCPECQRYREENEELKKRLSNEKA